MDIHKYNIVMGALYGLHRVLAVNHIVDMVAFFLDHFPENQLIHFVILRDQDS
ncbi:hypothetical protein D1872_351930 [compost metagenome]